VLKPPMVSWVLPQQAASMVQDGTKLVDVRITTCSSTESTGAAQISINGDAFAGATNIPLYRLREDMPGQLGAGGRVLVYCNTGERSAAAAFILNSMGYDVSALHGGLGAMLKLQAPAPA